MRANNAPYHEGARLIAPLLLLLSFCTACYEGHLQTSDFDFFPMRDDFSSEASDFSDFCEIIPEEETINELPDDTLYLPDTDEEIPPLFLSLSVTMNPNEAAPLVGVITAVTSQPTRLQATLEGEEGIETLRYTQWATEHRLPILGLSPDHIYHVTIAAETKEEGITTYPETFMLVTPPLHPRFPNIQHIFHRPPEEEREPGFFAIVLTTGIGASDDFGSQVALLDRRGNTRWLYITHEPQHGIEILPNGNFLFQFAMSIAEVNMFGEREREWIVEGSSSKPGAIIIPGVQRFHHSAIGTVQGTIVTLDNDNRTVEDYPTSDTDPNAPRGTVTLRGDAIVEFSLDGTVLRRHSLFDILDINRFGYLLLPGYQWSHTNYAFPVADDNSILLSVRHQSCVAKIDRETGALHWILGNHDNWSPTFEPYLLAPVGSPFAWPWYQHNARLTSLGTILLFDNGNFKAMPFDPPVPPEENWSRAVEYRVDETLMTVEQVWEWYPLEEKPPYCPKLGEARHLPVTDHIFVVFGAITEDTEATHFVRLFEVSHSTPATVLYEAQIADFSKSNSGWLVHGMAFRESLYPPGMLEEP